MHVPMGPEHPEFSPQDATRTLLATPTFEDLAKMRVEGLTWMLWGFVLAGIHVTYGFVSTAYEPSDLVRVMLWIPWVLGGFAASRAGWRAAAVTLPLEAAGSRTANAFLAALALSGVVGVSALLLAPSSVGPLAGMLTVSIAAIGLSRLDILTPAGRRVALALGLVGVAAASAGMAAGLPSSGRVLVGAGLGVVWFIGGMWESGRSEHGP
jgi:hypothetical protein